MYWNGAGTGTQIVMTQEKKEAVTQLAPRRACTASPAVVIGATILSSVLFLAAIATALTAAATSLVSVWCVPVLIKSIL